MDPIDPQYRFELAKLSVDHAAARHAAKVATVAGAALRTVRGVARSGGQGALLGARYVAGFARGLARVRAAFPNV